MKKPVIAALVASVLSLGGALSLEAAQPAPSEKAPTSTSAAPKTAAHSKKKVQHVKHVKKPKAAAHKSNPA